MQYDYHNENLFIEDMWTTASPQKRKSKRVKQKWYLQPLNQHKLICHAKPHALWTAMIVDNIFHQGKSKFLISFCFPAHF